MALLTMVSGSVYSIHGCIPSKISRLCAPTMRERGGVSMSMPLVNAEFVFTQPDGTRFRVRGTGDQHHAIFKTLDGYTVVRDQASGYYHYARLSDDGETLVPTGITAATAEPSAPRLKSERATAHDTGRGPAAHVVVAVGNPPEAAAVCNAYFGHRQYGGATQTSHGRSVCRTVSFGAVSRCSRHDVGG